MSLFKGNWDLPNSGEKILPAEEDAVIDKLARKVVDRGMAVPAIMFLESVKPLNFIGAQTMVFFEPIVQTVFNFKDYDALRTALEKRETIEIMLLRIEKFDAVSHAREKRMTKFLRQERKHWKWYQRYLGLFTPDVYYPFEVFCGPKGTAEDRDYAMIHTRQQRMAKFLNEERKRWKWYQRHLGRLAPDVCYPCEVLCGPVGTPEDHDFATTFAREQQSKRLHEEQKQRIKKYLKVQKKTWKWYQRYLGLFAPKVDYPDDVLYGPEGKLQKKDET